MAQLTLQVERSVCSALTLVCLFLKSYRIGIVQKAPFAGFFGLREVFVVFPSREYFEHILSTSSIVSIASGLGLLVCSTVAAIEAKAKVARLLMVS